MPVKDFNTLKKQKLGDILLERNYLTKPQLKQALEVQKETKQFIGEVLMQLGFLKERDLVAGLVIQNNIPYISIDQYEIDSNLTKIIPKEFANQFRVIPLELVGNILSLVMENPLDPQIQSELKQRLSYRIAPFISTKEEIERAIKRLYQ